MKNGLTMKRMIQVVLLGAALASPAMAQMGPGVGGNYGGGWGGGPGMQGGGWGMGPGGRGMHGGMHGMQGMGRGGMGPGMMAQQNVARGWQLMTPEERTAQQTKMRAVKTYDECKTVQTEHRTVMEARAKEKGLTLMSPRGNRCDMLKARGLIL